MSIGPMPRAAAAWLVAALLISTLLAVHAHAHRHMTKRGQPSGSDALASPVTSHLPSVLHPVLLIPGIGGSQLVATNEETGEEDIVWARVLKPDSTFREYLWGTYNRTTGMLDSLKRGHRIAAPQKNHGLFAIDSLNPEMWVLESTTYYLHDMIEFLRGMGFVPGKTLFGFPYDWRQSTAHPSVLDALVRTVEEIGERTGASVDIVSHSMGGLIVRNMLARAPETLRERVHSWVTIATPFHGAVGVAVNGMVQGYDLGHPFIDYWSIHQLAMVCPAYYQLLPDPHFAWSDPPKLTVRLDGRWQVHTVNTTLYEMLEEINLHNVLVYDYDGETIRVPLPFLTELHEAALRLSDEVNAAPRPRELGVDFYNIVGSGIDTPFHVTFEENVHVGKGVLGRDPTLSFVSGDGTVPRESMEHDGLGAVERVVVPGVDHTAMLNSGAVRAKLRQFLSMDCSWHGVWEGGGQGWWMEMRWDELLGGHEIAPGATGEQLRKYDASRHGLRLWRGHVHGNKLVGAARRKGVNVTFSLTMSDDCMSFEGSLTLPFPQSKGSRAWVGTRVVGDECDLVHTVGRCDGPHGMGERECLFGYWSGQCSMVRCAPGYTLHRPEADAMGRVHHMLPSECMPCPLGTFKSEDGDGECLPCVNGGEGVVWVGAAAQHSVCEMTCAPGYTFVDSGNALGVCVPCPSGTFKDGEGKQGCTQCHNKPDGSRYIGTGSTTELCAFACMRGFHHTLSGHCMPSDFTAGFITGALVLAGLLAGRWAWRRWGFMVCTLRHRLMRRTEVTYELEGKAV